MKNNFSGIYKDYMISYLENRELSYKNIKHYACYLKQFDKYTIDNKPNQIDFNKEYIEKYLFLRENESINTLAYRASIIKSFSEYLNLMGINAYIVNKKNYHSVKTFIPHIYTNLEINNIFDNINKSIKNTYQYPYKQEMYYLLFEILYSCGLRLSEALNIRYNDIDFSNMTICIKNSKNHITRNIIINKQITERIKRYMSLFNDLDNNSYLFNNTKYNTHLAANTVSAEFNNIIKTSKLNKSTRYRIHDLRHTFAVNNLKNAFINGEDINTFLPILMTYMGHQSIKSTEYYLRFTTDIYPEFINEYEKYFKDVIPTIGELEDE